MACFDDLMRVEMERAFTSVLLPQYESKLSERDRALCHELVLGTLRRQIYLDRVIERITDGKKLDAAVRMALRLGIYQLYFLDRVPTHSAVKESVDLVQRARKTSAKGFVNAILRRASVQRVEVSFADEFDKLSVETSHPPWLLDRWTSQFGLQTACDIASANNIVGRHAFRLIGSISLDGLSGVRPSEFVENCYVADRIDRNLVELAERGEIYFQEEASQMAASSVHISENAKFLDACAAPGGKTGLVVRRNRQALRLATAGDLHWNRVLLLRDNCRKQGVPNVEVVQYDGTAGFPFANGNFDVVLLDAPCSGTGTIRHNPEIRYFLEPSDIAELAAKQLRLLRNASKLVKHGGSLVYSTCSLEREENEEVIAHFLAEDTGFAASKPNVPDRFVTSGGFARTLPHRDGMDGFFIAELRKA
jgi:16S rRNA (cytosine967-C5)-methyltransferase